MKLKRAIALVLSIIMLMSATMLFASAKGVTMADGLEALQGQFVYGVGPETEGYAIDYRYFSPVGENDSTKYPLVIWLHGMGDGEYEGKQIVRNNMAYWTSDEYQSRFKNSGGAFVFAPRSPEEKEIYWPDSLIFPLRAAIDDFIAKNRSNIDISRIYIGGYSMGGRMTYKMAVAYPEMFAAAFPICPAWCPSDEACMKLADMPVWLTSGKLDPLVGYYTMVSNGWYNLTEHSNNPENCRFSSQAITAYANGVPTISAHYSWFAVNNDMFSNRNGKYPYMKTVDGNGKKVELRFSDGMISWLSSFTSDYDGAPATDSGNSEAKGEGTPISISAILFAEVRNLITWIRSLFK